MCNVQMCATSLFRDVFWLDQVPYLLDHSTDSWSVIVLYRLVEPPQPQRADSILLSLLFPYGAPLPSDAYFAHTDPIT